MKKLVINFATIFLFLLIFLSNNFIFAEKIICEVEEDHYGIYVALALYDNNDKMLCDIWLKKLDPDNINDNQKKALNLINGIEFDEDDARYDQLLDLTTRSNNLDYDRLHPNEFYEQRIQFNKKIFRILGQKVYEKGYRL